MDSQLLKTEVYHQLKQGRIALKKNSFKVAFYNFENAHILGQKHIVRHTISHYWMFFLGVKSKNSSEIIGQLTRIISALLFTLIWIPIGNTGGTNISPIKSIPITKELQKYF